MGLCLAPALPAAQEAGPRRLVPAEPPAETAAPDDAVRVTPLDPPPAYATGLPQGFAEDVWRNAPAGLLARLMRALPGPITDPAARALALRLLATPFEGVAGDEDDLSAARAGALGRLSATPPPDPCADESLAGALGCAALRDDPAAAELQLSLAREAGEAVAPALDALTVAWLSGAAPAKTPSLDTLPAQALPLLTRAPLNADEGFDPDAVSGPAAATLAGNPGLSPGLRAALAERAALTGSLDLEGLAAAYAALDGGEGAAAGRAGLYRNLAAAPDAAARLDALEAAWGSPDAGPFRPVWARLLAPFVGGFSPDGAVASRLGPLAAIPFAAGRPDKARAIEVLAGDTDAASALRALGNDAPPPGNLSPSTLALFVGLGRDVPPGRLDGVAGAVDLAAWDRLRAAEDTDAPGAKALAALDLLGEEPHEASPAARAIALDAVRRAGLADEALSIALSLAAADGGR